ncbi:hypothetical protein [Robertkochia flava]|uniref:hypothetical protein n=1 Tax=Robertkochia flava TaxID=3447986 RepID=UPI001CCEE0B5|nr:hypothetical protein [Robertkochia marina]
MQRINDEVLTNKVIPDPIASAAQCALEHFPELKNTPITFRFNEKAGKSVMKAQPEFRSFFRKRSQRRYYIFISRTFNLGGQVFNTKQIPEEVMIGWLGHELGHIMDYETRSKWNLFWFGLRYLFQPSYTRKAERVADTFAVENGMEAYILKTKNFILEHADLPERYKARIRRYYLSPEAIVELVQERDRIS